MPPVCANADCAPRIVAGSLSSVARLTVAVPATRDAAARRITSSNEVAPHTPHDEPAENRLGGGSDANGASDFNRTLTTLALRVDVSIRSTSDQRSITPSPYSKPTARS